MAWWMESLPMSRLEDERDEVEVRRLLAGAAKAVASACYCWLATTAENGSPSVRPMGRLQRDADDAYITLIGTATLRERAPEVRRWWKDQYEAYFPSEEDRANAAFVEIDTERMELWIRGVTPEPFGLHTTILERDGSGDWRLIVRGRNAAR